jgi:1-acyl-sn-glycerol-3-phosphate acyltransferase
MITAIFLISIFTTALTLSSIWPGLIPVWIVFAQLFGVVVVLLFFGLMVPFYKRTDSNNRFFGYLTRNLSFTLNHFILRLKVIPKGLENIPKDGKVVFFANHKSYTDPFVVLQMVQRNVAYAVKKGVYKLPLIGLWLQAMHCFMVDRDNNRDTVRRLMQAIKTVEKGQSMLIFPEGGTKDRDNDLIENMKHGAFKVAIKAEATIIPIRIVGNAKIRQRVPFYHTDREVIFLNPIPYESYKEMTTQEISQIVLQNINEAS